MENIHQEEFRACTWHVDRTERITVHGIFDYFQEVAGNHARSLGVGTESLREQNLSWILSRMSVKVMARPRWGSKIIARTWPRGTQRLFAIRDYELLDESETILAVGRSAWLILDLTAMRPKRPEPFAEGLPRNEGMDALPDGVAGVREVEGLQIRSSRKAAYSDIDYNGHVNNARYVQWIQDVLPSEALEGADSYRFDIDYLSETKADEVVDLAVGLVPEGAGRIWSIEGKKKDAPKPSFRAQFSC